MPFYYLVLLEHLFILALKKWCHSRPVNWFLPARTDILPLLNLLTCTNTASINRKTEASVTYSSRNWNHSPTGIFEVVTAVAWEEWEGIVMVTMVLVGAWVWDTEPKEKKAQDLSVEPYHTSVSISKQRGQKSQAKPPPWRTKLLLSWSLLMHFQMHPLP